MGFGYLFVGYLFFFNVAYAGLTDVIGVLLMLIGLSTLSKYAKGFRSALSVAIPLLVISLFSFSVAVCDLLSLSFIPDELSVFATILSHVLKCATLWLVLTGVREISHETGIPVLEARALRNRLLTPIYYLLAILTESSSVFGAAFPYFAAARMLFGLILTFLCAKCFFECYIWICLEGDENMEQKEGSRGIFGKLNEISARVDEETLRRKRMARTEKEQKRKGKSDRKGEKE